MVWTLRHRCRTARAFSCPPFFHAHTHQLPLTQPASRRKATASCARNTKPPSPSPRHGPMQPPRFLPLWCVFMHAYADAVRHSRHPIQDLLLPFRFRFHFGMLATHSFSSLRRFAPGSPLLRTGQPWRPLPGSELVVSTVLVGCPSRSWGAPDVIHTRSRSASCRYQHSRRYLGVLSSGSTNPSGFLTTIILALVARGPPRTDGLLGTGPRLLLEVVSASGSPGQPGSAELHSIKMLRSQPQAARNLQMTLPLVVSCWLCSSLLTLKLICRAALERKTLGLTIFDLQWPSQVN